MKLLIKRVQHLAALAFLLVAFGAIAHAQDVVISDFPLGVGGSVDPKIFEPYQAKLQAVADALRDNPSALAIITGGSDGERYQESHDAKNPGLALGRAHVLRRWLISHFDVDSTRLIIQSLDAAVAGSKFRFAAIRVVIPPKEKETIVRIEPAATTPQIEPTPVPAPSALIEHFGLQLGGGVAAAPFGGQPIISGAITWKQRIYVEAVGGYTIWNRDYNFDNQTLDTKRRLAGCNLIVYPHHKTRVGLLVGWTRIEQISPAYYEYVRLSEGSLFGLRVEPLHWLSLSGAWYPSKKRYAGWDLAETRNAAFTFSLTVHKLWGGAR